MDKKQNIRSVEQERLLAFVKGVVICGILSAFVALLAKPACSEGRAFVIADRPMSDASIELNVENVPIDEVMKSIWDEAPELSRGVLILGEQDVPLISVRYVGSIRDLDAALDAFLEAAGWTRTRTLRGVDVLYPSSLGGRSRTSRAVYPSTQSPSAPAGGAGVEPATHRPNLD